MKRLRFIIPSRAAFTLVELLVVVAIGLIMMALAVPAFNGMKSGTDVASTAASIQGLLQEARSYAMANNTIVFVGVTEVNGLQGSSASPQISGSGRVAMAMVASRDGTRGYDPNNPQNGWLGGYSKGANLVAIDRLQHFDNFHIPDFTSLAAGAGGMTRPALQYNQDNVGNAGCISATPFSWPLGSGTGAGQYTFNSVIEFDQQGVARIQLSKPPVNGTTATMVVNYLEIDLQSTHGTAVIPVTNQSIGNIAAIQIEGMTGAVHTYRP
jgi:prepilin-type N-terminal cleavage/methylation domain-containing protein